MVEKELLINQVKCLNCGTILTSYHTHDFQSCPCENQTFIDGGLEYQRFGGVNMTLVETGD